jgi:hypothetical protein
VQALAESRFAIEVEAVALLDIGARPPLVLNKG